MDDTNQLLPENTYADASTTETPTVSDAKTELESTGGYVPKFNDLTRTVIYIVCG